METNTKQPFELIAQEQQSALSLLKLTGLSVANLKQAAQQGSVWVKFGQHKVKRLRRLKKLLQTGDTIWLYYDPDILASAVTDATLISDQSDYSIWFKPRGMFSQPSKWSDANSIARNVEQQLSRPTYLVHRLDRMTSGLIILAHKRSLVNEFTTAFASGSVRKIYRAVVRGNMPDGSIEVTEPLDGKPSHSIIRPIKYDPRLDLTLLEVEIRSGKKHQIRRHLNFLNCPIIGDRQYGNAADQDDLQLAAVALEFVCPITTKAMVVVLPESYQSDNLLLLTD